MLPSFFYRVQYMHVICCDWPFYCRPTRKYPLQWMRTLWMKNGTISSWQWLKAMFGFIWIVNLKELSMPPFSYHLIFFHLLSKIWICYINVNLKKSQLIDISTWFTLTNDLRKELSTSSFSKVYWITAPDWHRWSAVGGSQGPEYREVHWLPPGCQDLHR